MAARIQQKLREVIASGAAPALGAIVVDRSNTKLDVCAGTINCNDEHAVNFTNDTQFLIQSCTKLVTAIAGLQLLEQGMIAMHDPVAKYLSKVSNLRICEGFDDEDIPMLRDAKTEMTIQHLFTHTSGVMYDFEPSMTRFRAYKGQDMVSLLELSAEWQYLDIVLDFDPGTGWHYGQSLDLLGFVIEEVSGLRLEDYMRTHIFEPLGMHNTGPAFTTEGNHLRAHFKTPNGLVAFPDLKPGSAETVWRFGGGHFLISTVHDFAQILKLLLNQGQSPKGVSVLRPETVSDYLFKDWLPQKARTQIYGADKIGELKTALSSALCFPGDLGYTFQDDDERGWSCGFLLNKKDTKLGRNAGSGSWGGLANTYYWIDPKAGVAGLVTSSQLPFLDPAVLEIFHDVEAWAYSGLKACPSGAE